MAQKRGTGITLLSTLGFLLLVIAVCGGVFTFEGLISKPGEHHVLTILASVVTLGTFALAIYCFREASREARGRKIPSVEEPALMGVGFQADIVCVQQSEDVLQVLFSSELTNPPRQLEFRTADKSPSMWWWAFRPLLATFANCARG